jgi:hypothetical protein
MKDPELRSVSLAARGLWIDMLSLMFECDRRGYLQLNGKPVNADQLARMTGCSTGEVSHCLQELDDSGVFSRSDDGTIYSRRLVRDEKKRANLRIRMGRFRQNGGGDPYRWAVVRVSILKRDGEICAYCGKRANTVDHITPRSDGGGESSSNLVACCKACNMKKSNRTPEQAGMEFWKGFNRNVLLTPLVTPTETPPFEDEDEIEVEITKPESLGKNPKTIKEVVAAFDFQGFAELIYQDYPRKVGRGAALKAIESAIRKVSKRNRCADFEAAKFIHDKVLEYAKSQAGNRGKFTPHCSTWMNELRFEDDEKEWNRDDRQDNSTEEAKRILGLAD